MFEHRGQPPISRSDFVRRLLRQGGYAAALVVASVLGGMTGYHYIAGFGWVDAFLDTAMLLGGMGPVHPLDSVRGKLFAGFFALYAGLVFLMLSALLLTPIFHRVLHRFHWEGQDRPSP